VSGASEANSVESFVFQQSYPAVLKLGARTCAGISLDFRIF